MNDFIKMSHDQQKAIYNYCSGKINKGKGAMIRVAILFFITAILLSFSKFIFPEASYESGSFFLIIFGFVLIIINKSYSVSTNPYLKSLKKSECYYKICEVINTTNKIIYNRPEHPMFLSYINVKAGEKNLKIRTNICGTDDLTLYHECESKKIDKVLVVYYNSKYEAFNLNDFKNYFY
jgi:hypothetical protein